MNPVAKFRIPWVGVVLTVLILLLGWASGGVHRGLEEKLLRNELLNQAVLLARGIPPAMVERLTFSEDDVGTMAFDQITRYLRAFSKIAGIESVYTMALKGDDQIVFGPESIEPDNPLASAPGTVYEEPSDLDWLTLREGTPTVNGPFTDEYGTFVGAVAPVVHPRTGKILMAVGLDIEAGEWNRMLILAQVPSMIFTGALIVVVWGFLILMRPRGNRAGLPPRCCPVEAVGIAAGGVILSLMAGWASFSFARTEDILQENERVSGLFNYYLEELRRVENATESLATFLQIHPEPSPGEFRNLAWKKMRYSSIDALGWAPKFEPGELPGLDRRLRAEFPEFTNFYAANAVGARIPPPSLDVYFVVTREATTIADLAFLGLVMNGEAVRAAAIQRAIETRWIESTPPVVLVGDQRHNISIALYHAVYSPYDDRLLGIVAAAIRPETLLERDAGLLGFGADLAKVRLLFLDAASTADPGFSTRSFSAPQVISWALSSDSVYLLPIFALGQPIAIYLEMADGGVMRTALIAGAQSGGLVLALMILIAVVIGRQSLRQERLEEAVESRTGELRDALEKSEQLAEEARKADVAKSAFLATMSHEIRTPLNGVVGFTQLLRDTPLSAEQMDFVQTIHSSGETLLGLINDILDYSKIEAGKLEIEEIPFSLPLAIEESLDVVSGAAGTKGLDLSFNIDPGAPFEVEGDPLRLKQVLINLLSNAVKFTKRGGISCSVSIAGPPDGDRVPLLFEITDTGIGIPADKQERLFKVFSQVDSSNTRQFGGTGLGLAISKRIVELMGGSIGVRSVPGAGSTFWIRLPLRQIPGRRALDPEPPADILSGKRVLVVDDIETNRKLLENLVPAWGGVCIAVDGWPAASGLLKAGASFDLVLMDFQMPDISGVEATKILRELLGDRTPPVILLSSQTAECPPELFAGRLMKPLKTDTLRVLCQRVLGSARHERTNVEEVRPSLSPEARSLRLLVAEDSPVNQKLILLQLERLGIRPILAENGAVALAACSKAAFDAILLDCQMPEMDGFEATRRIRQMEKTIPGRTPAWIIALTAGALEQDRKLAFDAGMDDFLTKPLRVRGLVAALERAATRTPPPAPGT